VGEVDDYLAGLDPGAAGVLGAVYARALELVPEAEQGTGFGLSKGTIRFTAEQPIPEPVVTRIVELRRAEIDG
jgi:hypothetical protein